jgi:hypothetical protein
VRLKHNYFHQKNNCLTLFSTIFAAIVLLLTLVTGFTPQMPSWISRYTQLITPFHPIHTRVLPNEVAVNHLQTSDMLDQLMADASAPKTAYQTIYLRNNYAIMFNQWILYIIKDRKNILGKGVPFVQSQQKLTLASIKTHLMNTDLWPKTHTLHQALHVGVANSQ